MRWGIIASLTTGRVRRSPRPRQRLNDLPKPCERMEAEAPTGADRCWPCTVANSVVGLVVAWVPLAAAAVRGRPALIALAAGWGVAVTGYTAYRLVALGYLPLAEPVARWTGLHDRIGPGANQETHPEHPDDLE